MNLGRAPSPRHVLCPSRQLLSFRVRKRSKAPRRHTGNASAAHALVCLVWFSSGRNGGKNSCASSTAPYFRLIVMTSICLLSVHFNRQNISHRKQNLLPSPLTFRPPAYS
ncbi:unnamed protein product, partial [Phaeothamnion confervicola]